MRARFPTAALVLGLIVLGIVAGFLIAVVPPLVLTRSWGALIAIAVFLIGTIALYRARRLLPLKFIFPGVVFMVALLIVPILLTAQLSTTNYGDGTRLTRQQVVDRLVWTSAEPVPGASVVPAAIGTTGSTALGPFTLFVATADGTVLGGTSDTPAAPVPASQVDLDGGRVVAVDGYTLLTPSEVNRLSAPSLPLSNLAVDAGGGSYWRLEGLGALEVRPTLTWDEQAETLTEVDSGEVYTATRTERGDRSYFVAADGSPLSPQSWQEEIGAFNYVRLFTDPEITGDFLRILVWTIVFATLTVATQFALGLGLAISLDDRRLRAQRFWRAFLLLPYAIPSFITILVWSNFWNRDFGLINDLLGIGVDWFGQTLPAQVAVLVTNMWLGFPYMFLISTGALQTVPGELKEAALIDGARGWTRFRRVTFPLVLASLSPLLVASFAANFNNFNIIQLLTGGGPFSAQNPTAGGTDILISYTYRLAFGNSGSQIGFASAVSVVLFILTAVLAMIQFRALRRTEEVF